MPDTLYPMGHEIAKVQAEIVVYRNEYLPVFLEISRTPELIPPIALERQQGTFHLLSSWQGAITRVGDALPLPGDTTTLNREEFKNFMFCEGTPGYPSASSETVLASWLWGFQGVEKCPIVARATGT